jgi:hypothetical protein
MLAAPHLLLDTSCLSDTATAKLMIIADTAALNLRLPDAEIAAQLLIPLCLPKYDIRAVCKQSPLLKWVEDNSGPESCEETTVQRVKM